MPTFIEVCSGAEGLSTGLMQAGFQPLLLNEIDKHSCNTLRTNHPNTHIVEGSMTNLDLSEYAGCDLLAGGVPCQAFSHAGLRKGLHDPRGQLIVEFKCLVNECMPKVFFVENVKGLKSHDGGNTLKILIGFFEDDSYSVSYEVLNSFHYGVPQKRERNFIVGIRKDIPNTFSLPTPININERKILKDVLVNVPPSLGQVYPDKKKQVLDLVPPGGCWIHLPKEIQMAYMGERMLASGGGKRGVARRMSLDEPCLTLTTSPCQKQTERCHPEETRPFTVREYERIQTFDDSYTFCGSMNQQYRQIGNAVPVKLAFEMGESVLKVLN